jgi:hypothetical protein
MSRTSSGEGGAWNVHELHLNTANRYTLSALAEPGNCGMRGESFFDGAAPHRWVFAPRWY